MQIDIFNDNNQIAKVVYSYNKDSKQEAHMIAFDNFVSAIRILNQSVDKQLREMYYNKFEFRDLQVTHNLPQGSKLYQKNEIEQPVFDQLFDQITKLFKEELYICAYDFQYIINCQQNYYFLLLPGLIQFDDATERHINLNYDIINLVRPQIIYKLTNKKLEILSFFKNYTIFQQQQRYSDLIQKNSNGIINLLMRENIYLEEYSRDQSYIILNFYLAYNKSRIQKYPSFIKDFNQKQYEIIQQQIKVPIKHDNNKLLRDIEKNLGYERQKMQEFSEQNQRNEELNKLDLKIEEAIEKFYSEQDKLKGNYELVQEMLGKRLSYEKIVYNDENNQIQKLEQYQKQVIQNLEQYKQQIEQLNNQN